MHGLLGFSRTTGARGVVRGLGALTMVAVVAVMLVAVGSGRSVAHGRLARSASQPGFVSLVPACACGRHTVLSEFSLSDGRRIKTIMTVPTVPGEFYSLSGGRSGKVLMTVSRPAQCTSEVNGCGPQPNTCASQVSRLVAHHFETIFTAGDSVQIQAAAANADGRRIALVLSPCTTGAEAIVVRDLATGSQRSLGNVPRCSGVSVPAFSRDGRQLVFAYSAVPNPRRLPPPGICPETRYASLAIAPTGRPTAPHAWRLVPADRGCSYEASTFDAAGIAAVEGCRRRGVSGSFIDPGLGQAVLLQLDHHNRVTERINLKPGWEQGVITTEPSGAVLISQDQPANEPYPERDWVWELSGRHLRLVASYTARDAAQILAVAH